MRAITLASAALVLGLVAGSGCGGNERGGSAPSGSMDGGSAGATPSAGNSPGAGSPGFAGGGQSAGGDAAGNPSTSGRAGEGAGGSAQIGGAAGGGAGGLVDCDTRKVICKRVQPQCPAMQVPSVVGTCYGECVKIDSCACSSAEQCPDAEQYTCWGKMHCGPYVR